ncbi:NTP transferase domain-containing protein [Sphingomonas sp. R-74633]|uniref:molybdenum cofactor guanylyltransferase n=1 Tax=Sphingomonas sp. R-74633 TaxID=2751188 RepID=UPI0015D2B5B4|nr:NTP transferase domain-containing protein [Sphingomonas sp. R-74633]NYT41958.1 NTP transferase domain-containing protein [Sphingomonas sp. R-74633]
MRILGAVLAGGQSTRFGSDKALATIDGIGLIDHAVSALAAHAGSVVSCGRPWRELDWIPDRPLGGGGPLTGLNAALHLARKSGFDAVLCAPLDVHPLSKALPLLAGARCAVLRTQWTIGLWPTALAPALDRHLASGARSIRSWLHAADAAFVEDAHLALRNINTASDLPGAQRDFSPFLQ